MDVILLGEISDLISGVNTNISNTKGSVDWGNGYLQNTIYPELITTRDHAVSSNNNASSAHSYLANNVWPYIYNNIWPTLANQIWPHLLQVYNTRDVIAIHSDNIIKVLSNGGSIECPLDNGNNNGSQSKTAIYDGCWCGSYIKHSGLYRMYGTAGITVNQTSADKMSSAKVSMIASVTRASGGGNSWYEVDLVEFSERNQSNGASAAQTTKYIDIPLQRGDYVLTLYRLTGTYQLWACSSASVKLANFVANCGQQSLRGTFFETEHNVA